MRQNRHQTTYFFTLAGVLAFGALAPRALPQELANRQIRDVRLIVYRDEVYRIAIGLSQLTEYSITPPRPGKPLRIDIARCELAPGVRANPASNALVRQVWITPSDAGIVSLEIPLATSQIEVRDFTIATPEAAIVVDLKLRSGIQLPSAALSM